MRTPRYRAAILEAAAAHAGGALWNQRLRENLFAGVSVDQMFLRSKNLPRGLYYTSVPASKLAACYTTDEGGAVHGCWLWPNEYLTAIRTGRLGAQSFAALWIEGSRWKYDTVLKRLYYSPWRFDFRG